jgi:SAM-dependent methyltransferase
MNIFQYATATIKRNFSLFGAYLRFTKDFISFSVLNRNDGRFRPQWINQYPCLTDWTPQTAFDAHYIYHPAWAARVVKKIKPKKHIDISSTVTFCSMLSAFVPVEFYDYRPAPLFLDNLKSLQGDLMKLPFRSNSVESISCMHTIEHIGLGRYGDPLDPQGDLKAIQELKRVVRKGGSLIFVTPIGKPTLRFNAHRIYSYAQILQYFEGFKLVEFSLLPDDTSKSGLIKNATKKQANAQHWGCGCFWFKKN